MTSEEVFELANKIVCEQEKIGATLKRMEDRFAEAFPTYEERKKISEKAEVVLAGNRLKPFDRLLANKKPS